MASLFFPKKNRQSVHVLYACLRHMDDVVDTGPSNLRDLSDLKEQIFGSSSSPHFIALQQIIKTKNIPPHFFADFLEGLRMDLANDRYQSLRDLELYCFRVAGVVGLMMCPLMGVTRFAALNPACALGIAMQLTNVCRDIKEDAINNRVYVPCELLSKDVEAANLVKQPELAHAAVIKILHRAEVLYKEGQEGLVHLPFRAALAVAVASVLYREIGRKLLARSRKNAHLTMNQRTVVGGFAKLKCVMVGSLIAIVSRFQKQSPSLSELPIQDWNYVQHFY